MKPTSMIASIALMMFTTTQATEGADCLTDQKLCDTSPGECCGYVYSPVKYGKKQETRIRMCSNNAKVITAFELETGYQFSCTDPQSVWDDSAISLQMAQLLTMVGIAAYLV